MIFLLGVRSLTAVQIVSKYIYVYERTKNRISNFEVDSGSYELKYTNRMCIIK